MNKSESSYIVGLTNIQEETWLENPNFDNNNYEKKIVNEKNICHSCKKEGKTLLCSRCKRIKYFSKECQIKDWNDGGHSKICN